MIRFENVSKSFWTGGRQKVILHNASFTVNVGRNLGILAPNGTGKTTLINMMAGLEQPDHGKITRKGRISWPVGYSGGIVRNMSGAENIRYISRLYDRDELETLAFCIDFAELGHYMDMPVRTYSSGMVSRLVFAILMAIDFDYYLVDEGASAGDKEFSKKASAMFRERLDYSTLIMVSHSAETLEMYCNSAAVLLDGQLHLFDTLEEARVLYDYA
ncbi:ABC transporter ATP-binding protein [Rhodobacteraceae bacterium NNCM2]|nr:ABC transporter ATP-binding protein [Coraliihabitans acroporae]